MRRILWFRRDLRIEDNPLLSLGGEVFPIFIFDSQILENLAPNDRRITFIYHALMNLKKALRDNGLDIALFYGKPIDVFRWILHNGSYDEVCASGDYDPYTLERDRDISHLLPFHYLHDTYIFKPDEILKSDSTPYLVFTPFYNRAKTLYTPEHQQRYPHAKHSLIPSDYASLHRIENDVLLHLPLALSSIGFEMQSLTETQQLTPHEKLDLFASKITAYKKDRDFLGLDATSHLGTDLRFGTLSIRILLRWLAEQKKRGIDTEPFFRQLIFRDFYAMLLYHFPHLSTHNFRYPFYGIENQERFETFCTATTGVPIIDAGINELLSSGEMHNRVRMICASFFTKNLLLPWQWGERFFAQHLMDYDAASNILSWQWSAGTGVDPQPYFRIFNPYTQQIKFDKEEVYLHRWLPKNQENLTPIVSHQESSKKALEYFRTSLAGTLPSLLSKNELQCKA